MRIKVEIIYPADDTDRAEWRHQTTEEGDGYIEILEKLFRRFNCVDGTEECVMLKVRSMSVGDVVHDLEMNRHFICDTCGWVEVSEKFFDVWKRRPFSMRLLGPTKKQAADQAFKEGLTDFFRRLVMFGTEMPGPNPYHKGSRCYYAWTLGENEGHRRYVWYKQNRLLQAFADKQEISDEQIVEDWKKDHRK